MNRTMIMRLLGSVACCVIFGCRPSPEAPSREGDPDGVSAVSARPDEETDQPRSIDSGGERAAQAESQNESDSVQASSPPDQPPTPAPATTGAAPAGTPVADDDKPSKKPGQLTKAGGTIANGPAPVRTPTIETETKKPSTPVESADEDQPTEVRETFFPNGATRRQWIVKVLPDGTEVEHGEALLWYDNGQVKLQGEYVDGVREGLWLSWHPNGNNRGEGRLHRDRRIGTWIMWHDNGRKRSEGTYDKGLKHGRSTAWDADGNVIKTGEYVRNKKHGIWINYVDGEKTETEWVNGVQVE